MSVFFWLASCVDSDCKYRGKSTDEATYIVDGLPKIFGMLLKAFLSFYFTVLVIKDCLFRSPFKLPSFQAQHYYAKAGTRRSNSQQL